MKKIISLLIITIFILSSCSNSEDFKKIEELEKQVFELNNKIEKNNDFDKKIQCGEINFHEDIKSNWGTFAEKYSIDEIFYSNSKNTCIGIITLYSDNGKRVWLYDILEKNWFLSKELNYFGGCDDGKIEDICYKSIEIFDNRIKKLKQ